jgi:cell division septal protein FtsQ
VLALLLALNVATGAFLSLATRVTSVQVSGAMPHDQVRIEGILGRLRNTPALRIDRTWTEWEVLQAPEVRSARLEVTLIGRAYLRVVYRVPVVRIEDRESLVMDKSGVLFALPPEAVPSDLPLLRIPRGLPPTLLTLTGDWPAATIGELSRQVRELPDGNDVRIDVDDRGAVCLNIARGNSAPGRVVLGSTDEMEKKLEAYRRWRASDAEKWDEVAELNLMDPDRPSELPR